MKSSCRVRFHIRLSERPLAHNDWLWQVGHTRSLPSSHLRSLPLPRSITHHPVHTLV